MGIWVISSLRHWHFSESNLVFLKNIQHSGFMMVRFDLFLYPLHSNKLEFGSGGLIQFRLSFLVKDYICSTVYLTLPSFPPWELYQSMLSGFSVLWCNFNWHFSYFWWCEQLFTYVRSICFFPVTFLFLSFAILLSALCSFSSLFFSTFNILWRLKLFLKRYVIAQSSTNPCVFF